MWAQRAHIPGEGVQISTPLPLTRIARQGAIRPLPPGEVRDRAMIQFHRNLL
jgi:hypothetical protein